MECSGARANMFIVCETPATVPLNTPVNATIGTIATTSKSPYKTTTVTETKITSGSSTKTTGTVGSPHACSCHAECGYHSLCSGDVCVSIADLQDCDWFGNCVEGICKFGKCVLETTTVSRATTTDNTPAAGTDQRSQETNDLNLRNEPRPSTVEIPPKSTTSTTAFSQATFSQTVSINVTATTSQKAETKPRLLTSRTSSTATSTAITTEEMTTVITNTSSINTIAIETTTTKLFHACSSHADCSYLSLCNRGECALRTELPDCGSSGSCAEGVCEYGKCVVVASLLNTPETAVTTTVRTTTAAPPQTCSHHADCGYRFLCNMNICVLTTDLPDCNSSTTCVDRVCEYGKCVVSNISKNNLNTSATTSPGTTTITSAAGQTGTLSVRNLSTKTIAMTDALGKNIATRSLQIISGNTTIDDATLNTAATNQSSTVANATTNAISLNNVDISASTLSVMTTPETTVDGTVGNLWMETIANAATVNDAIINHSAIPTNMATDKATTIRNTVNRYNKKNGR